MGEPSTDSVVQSLDSSYQQTKEAVAQCRRTSRIIAWVTVVVFLCYCYAIYGNLTANWTKEQLTTAANREVEKLAPIFHAKIVEVANEIAPVYQAEMSKTLDAAMPELTARSKKAFQETGDAVAKNAEGEVRGMFDRVLAKHENRLKAEFPSLRSDADVEAMTLRWKHQITEDTNEVIKTFLRRYETDVADLQSTIGMFGTDRLKGHDRDYVVRYFIHLWLALLDRHILGNDSPRRPR